MKKRIRKRLKNWRKKENKTPDLPALPIIGIWQGKIEPLCEINGKMIHSAFNKKTIEGSMKITFGGFATDEHDSTHGGSERALLHYDSNNYDSLLSERKALDSNIFKAPAFGENLTTKGWMNESTVCIGDKYQLGTAIIEINMPRFPCQKISKRNHDNGLTEYAKKYAKTGWFYRVIKEGDIKIEDHIKIMERKFPDWTVERVMVGLYGRNKKVNGELVKMNEQEWEQFLVDLTELEGLSGKDWKDSAIAKLRRFRNKKN